MTRRAQKVNQQSLNVELRKLSDEEKITLAEKLLKEVQRNDTTETGEVAVADCIKNKTKVYNKKNALVKDCFTDENKNEINIKQASYQDTEFDNPFNTNPPETPGSFQSEDGTWHHPALKADSYILLKLTAVNQLGVQQSEYEFALPRPTDYTGCIPGQYVKVRVQTNGKYCERFFSPVSATSEFGKIVLMLKYETNGEISKRFQKLQIGELKQA